MARHGWLAEGLELFSEWFVVVSFLKINVNEPFVLNFSVAFSNKKKVGRP